MLCNAKSCNGCSIPSFAPMSPWSFSSHLASLTSGAGFQGKLDFIYLPMDPRSRNARGFAFCNFSTPAAADEFCGRSGAPGASKNPSGAERKTRGVRS